MLIWISDLNNRFSMVKSAIPGETSRQVLRINAGVPSTVPVLCVMSEVQ